MILLATANTTPRSGKP